MGQKRKSSERANVVRFTRKRTPEGPIVNYPRASSYPPRPKVPEGFWNPAQRSDSWPGRGFSFARWARILMWPFGSFGFDVGRPDEVHRRSWYVAKVPGTDSCTAANSISIRSPRRRGRAAAAALRGRV